MPSYYLTRMRLALRGLAANLRPSTHIAKAIKNTETNHNPASHIWSFVVCLTLNGEHIGHYVAGSPLANEHNKRQVVRAWWWRRFIVRRIQGLSFIVLCFFLGWALRYIWLPFS